MSITSEIKAVDQVVTDEYAIYHGDSCEVIKAIPDNSIHFGIHSPHSRDCTNSQIVTETSATARADSSGNTINSSSVKCFESRDRDDCTVFMSCSFRPQKPERGTSECVISVATSSARISKLDGSCIVKYAYGKTPWSHSREQRAFAYFISNCARIAH